MWALAFYGTMHWYGGWNYWRIPRHEYPDAAKFFERAAGEYTWPGCNWRW